MALVDALTQLQTAAKLKINGSGNEANTKALLIEPMIAALGWDPADLDSVEREVKVLEGTFLDYALKLHSTARVYVEAKGLNENLDDKKFIAQTVNYANNDGVLWCVLTNGSRVRVYKTNEPVAIDRKLLFEVDLTDDSETGADKAKLLRLISREAVEAGDVDGFGERVFTRPLHPLVASGQIFVERQKPVLGGPALAERLVECPERVPHSSQRLHQPMMRDVGALVRESIPNRDGLLEFVQNLGVDLDGAPRLQAAPASGHTRGGFFSPAGWGLPARARSRREHMR